MTECSRFPCPCCGFRTLSISSPSDEICPVCFWQDDYVDNQDTDTLGPNRVRLSIARQNFARYGASDHSAIPHVRPPHPAEGPPEPWTEQRAPDEL